MKNLKPAHLFAVSVFIMLFVTLNTYAFDYNISFTASGASTTIDYVVVQNLTQGTAVTVSAGSALEVTAINQVATNDESLHIYPNPIQDKATVSYYSNAGGNTQINVFGIDGRILIGIVKNLSMGINHFELSMPKGAYTLQINENGKLHSAKILSQSNNTAGIKFTGTDNVISDRVQKVKATTVPMQYNYGDFILFKAYAGNYVSILTDILSGSKTINFNFVECKDVDGNYYSTVTIGTQVWMAENMKTSKYRNNIAITDKTNLSTWGTSTSEASSDYATPSNSTTYGKLYNWYATSSNNNLAPLGWHIPADADWTTLSDFLGGLNLAGDKLKEIGNLHWATANTTATNITGFTAIPGGSRSTDNTVYDIGNIGYWWSSSEGTTKSNAWYRSLSSQNTTVTRGYYAKGGGMTVRCLMGDLPILTTTSALSINATGFVSGGNITFDGNLPIISCGVCWSTNQNPTINDSKTNDGTSTGAFISTVTGLAAQTTYYVRGYATNSYGTAYGTQVSFSTKLPTLTTSAVSSITDTTATCGGNITDIEGVNITSRGVCWSTNSAPTIALSTKTSDGSGSGAFTSSITGLTVGITYYVRAYATNSIGSTYGNEISFTTGFLSSAELFGLTFDEGTGTQLKTSGINAWTALLTAGPSQLFGTKTALPTFVKGHKGMAMHFTAGSHLEINDYTASALLGSKLSIAVWVKTDSIRANNYILSYNDWYTWKFQTQDGGKPFFTVTTTTGGTDADNKVDNSVPNLTWTHLVVSMDLVAQKLDFYVNGVNTMEWTSVTKPNLHGTVTPYTAVSASKLPLLIGAAFTFAEANAVWPANWNWGTIPNWGYFTGSMDELKVYNVALTDEQVSFLYNNEK